MATLQEIMLRAQALREETAVDSISPERAGSIMYDTLAYINQMQLQGANPLLISKIYTTVEVMEADSAPVSDLTGQPLRPGQVVCIASGDPDDPDEGMIYRYDGTEGDVSSWTTCGRLGSDAYLEGYQYMGVAKLTPAETDPGSPTQKVFYLASEPGTYDNFGDIVVNSGEVAALKFDGSSWSKEVTGAASVASVAELGQETHQIQSILPVAIKETEISSKYYTQTVYRSWHDLGVYLQKGTYYKIRLKLVGFPLYRFGSLVLTSNASSGAVASIDVTSLFGTNEEIVSGEWREAIFIDTTSVDGYPYKYLRIAGTSSSYAPDGQVYIEVLQENNSISEIATSLISKQYNIASPYPTTPNYYLVAGVQYTLYIKTRQEEGSAIGSSYGIYIHTDNGDTQLLSIPLSDMDAGTTVNFIPTLSGLLCIRQKNGTFTTPNIADIVISANFNLKTYNEYMRLHVIAARKIYSEKGCIFIGDSISTSDNYYWKGYIRDMCGLEYALNISSSVGHSSDTDDANMWPADGGIKVVPPESEYSTIADKSIWYRCAENRLASYLRYADYISFFGGANDLTTEGLQLGSVHDTPYVDDVTTFPAEKQSELTDVRPAELTFASAYMGCIEMLHRDFPNAKILLPTVFPFLNTGNDVDAEGVTLSERMAILQLQIASKYNGEETPPSKQKYPSCDYGVLAIPFYWDMRTKVNSVIGAFAKDGVHPNTIQARRMAQVFIDTLETF